jgi:hypothetical protein
MLTIKNWDKLLGDRFVYDRFMFSNFEETGTKLRFWFKDLQDKIPAGGVWVEIERKSVYAKDRGYGMFRVIYPNCNEHKIGADWFSDIDNARWTFETALKTQ